MNNSIEMTVRAFPVRYRDERKALQFLRRNAYKNGFEVVSFVATTRRWY